MVANILKFTAFRQQQKVIFPRLKNYIKLSQPTTILLNRDLLTCYKAEEAIWVSSASQETP